MVTLWADDFYALANRSSFDLIIRMLTGLHPHYARAVKDLILFMNELLGPAVQTKLLQSVLPSAVICILYMAYESNGYRVDGKLGLAVT